jgi:hypothetical protein
MEDEKNNDEDSILESIGNDLFEMIYSINWHISHPYVARARQMPSLKEGLIATGGLYANRTRCVNTRIVIDNHIFILPSF